MDYRTFPATGDDLSVLGFGAMGMTGWFGDIDDNDAISALHTALDLGVNVVDTARAYQARASIDQERPAEPRSADPLLDD